MGHFANEATDKFRYLFNILLADRLKTLLETKHLYQRVSIKPAEDQKRLETSLSFDQSELTIFQIFAAKYVENSLCLTDKQLFSEPGHRPQLCLIVGNVKLFCTKSGMREAFRPIWFSDITSQLISANAQNLVASKLVGQQQQFKISFGNNFQVFSLAYQCQHCEGIPNIFLIKRVGLNLTIEGRSPIEHVEIANYIPKIEEHWFSDAVVGFQSGKILAGLFYLRTFIEQFARRITGLLDERKTGDEIMTAYSATLPPQLRETMPSLGECYDRLSAALHGAKEEVELFETVVNKIEKHFDIRRVHDLDVAKNEPPPRAAASNDEHTS